MADGARIKEARKAKGLTQAELAEQMGVTQSVVSDWERGELQSWREVAERLAQKLDKPKGYFGVGTMPVLTTETEVVGEVQAGAFRRALEFPPDERTTIPVVRSLGGSGVRQVALRVLGPSMDLLYPDGSYVIVVSAADTDVRHGDKVVVYQHQGELTEATIKQVMVEADGRVALWPRSTHPDHQEPIYLVAEDQDGPEIAYVVVASYLPEDRPAPPIQMRRRRAG